MFAKKNDQQECYECPILKRNLQETVNALMRMAEKRDPYTTNHQYRVARLAGAIAKKIGLNENQFEGIVIAGTLHDLGKICIPTDLLNKPGSLTYIEMAIIKTHPQVGYDIIKNLPFEFPVADIVIQHHERLDGSGYPAGLTGDEILFEARILAVADVVEAMASHRPYRPSLGLEVPLKEIENNTGKLYDPKVVAACLKLFQNQGFDLG